MLWPARPWPPFPAAAPMRVASGRTPNLADPVHRAQKARHEPVRRAKVHLLRRAHLFDSALVHHGQPIRHRQRLFLVVRHQQKGDPYAPLHGLQFQAHLLAELGVERGQRLVEQ